MRYAVITDIHANLEALEAVLAKIDELAQEEPVEHIWFLGDLVGYGPNPNECIVKLRARTETIIAGNHDWAAVGKIDLEDFSEAARVSAEWTAEQLTEEHRQFLTDLPEHLEIGECTLVHGSPYGPLWEYLTSEALAERSFEYFGSRFCLVGHTHVPVIFQQPDASRIPTRQLTTEEQESISALSSTHEEVNGENHNHHDNFENDDDDDETKKMVVIRPQQQAASTEATSNTAHQSPEPEMTAPTTPNDDADDEDIHTVSDEAVEAIDATAVVDATSDDDDTTPEATILNAEEHLNEEIEELLSLLGLSQSMIQTTNEMVIPPEGLWQPPDHYRAIVNPGGVGQPRDGDPRAALMIYDTERGFTFYRVEYDIEKTQEKIIKAGLPQYLATRLAYGR
jgi:diadenosine tetraphosphatase ApaH/serine/threonine PP2A family protein phosphatase